MSKRKRNDDMEFDAESGLFRPPSDDAAYRQKLYEAISGTHEKIVDSPNYRGPAWARMPLSDWRRIKSTTCPRMTAKEVGASLRAARAGEKGAWEVEFARMPGPGLMGTDAVFVTITRRDQR